MSLYASLPHCSSPVTVFFFGIFCCPTFLFEAIWSLVDLQYTIIVAFYLGKQVHVAYPKLLLQVRLCQEKKSGKIYAMKKLKKSEMLSRGQVQ